MRQLCEDCHGVFGTLKQAVDELGIPRLKKVRPVPSYRGVMTLGDPEQYDTAMSIDVERYPRTMVSTPQTASNFVVRSDMGTSSSNGPPADEAEMPDVKNDLTSVHNAHTYQVKDEEAPGGKRDVNREELAKGYEYGRTAVHISESDQNVTKLETKAGLEIVGFVPKQNVGCFGASAFVNLTLSQYDHYMNMTRSNTIIAQRINEKAVMAFSSFIHALYELDNIAIARLVVKDGKDPIMLAMAPSIEPGYECLVDVEVPFAEDVRSYKFAPLDRIVTVSGRVLGEHRNLPNWELLSAMDHFIDGMDLSTFGRDDDGWVPCRVALELERTRTANQTTSPANPLNTCKWTKPSLQSSTAWTRSSNTAQSTRPQNSHLHTRQSRSTCTLHQPSSKSPNEISTPSAN